MGNRHGVQAPVPRLQSEEGLSVNPSAHAGAARKSKKPLLKSHMKGPPQNEQSHSGMCARRALDEQTLEEFNPLGFLLGDLDCFASSCSSVVSLDLKKRQVTFASTKSQTEHAPQKHLLSLSSDCARCLFPWYKTPDSKINKYIFRTTVFQTLSQATF